MKAMIMAAGFGTRLKPLTDNTPKALVPVLNMPVLERNIRYLNKYGIRDIIINAHYHREQVQKFVSGFSLPQINLSVNQEEEILGTGGGISNCRSFLKDDTFIVINVDILTDINLDKAVKSHRQSGCPVTMVMHDCKRFNQVETAENRIRAIHKDTNIGRLAFTGIHVIEPEIFSILPEKGYSEIIRDCYNPLLESGRPINAFTSKEHYWYDIGTIASYIKANMDFLKFENKRFVTGKNVNIDPSASLENCAVIGNNVTVEKHAVIDSSVILDDTVIKSGTHIKDSVVISNTVTANASHPGQ